jgi:hypothetical protein
MDITYPTSINKPRGTPAFTYLEDTVSGGWRSVRDTDLATSSLKSYVTGFSVSWAIKPTAGIVYAVNGYNSGATSGYIQVWDNTGFNNAGLISTVKYFADSNIAIEYGDKGVTMNSGIIITASSNPLTFVAPTTTLLLSALYK